MIQIIVNPRVRSTRARLEALLDKLPAGPWVISLAPHGDGPTLQQHRYYRGAINRLCEQTGQDPGEVHAELMERACVPEMVRKDGQVIMVTPSSKDISKALFSRLIETLHVYAAESGFHL